jgi:hypothetical protein
MDGAAIEPADQPRDSTGSPPTAAFVTTTDLASANAWVTSMNTSGYFGVSLRVRHDTQSPGEISKVLGREANIVATKGGRRGSPSSRAISSVNYWCADFEIGAGPAERIAAIARFLEGRESAMQSLLQSGGRADIYVFIAPEFETVPIVLEASVLAILGRSGVQLGLEIVPRPKKKRQGTRREP